MALNDLEWCSFMMENVPGEKRLRDVAAWLLAGLGNRAEGARNVTARLHALRLKIAGLG